MAKSPTFASFAGIRNTLPAERLHALPTKDDPTCDLVEAVNVDIDNSGQAARRAGQSIKRAGAAHSLWAQGDMCLFVTGTTLRRLYPDYTSELLASGLTANLPMAYVEVNGRVYWANGVQSGVLADGRSRSWGMEIPATPGLSAIGGYLTAGKYQCLVTHIRSDSQESGAGLPGQIELAAEGGIRVTWELPDDTDIDHVQVYLSEPNGMILYAAGVPVDVDDLFAEITSARLALPLNTQWQDKPPAGTCLAYSRGVIYIAKAGFVFPTTALGYEYCDLRDYLALDGSGERFLIGVEHGLFYGNAKRVYFLAGDRLADFTVTTISETAGVRGSALHVDGEMATGLKELAGKTCAMFTCGDGVMLGLPDGSVMNLTQERYRFTATAVGAAGFHQSDTLNQYLLFLQS